MLDLVFSIDSVLTAVAMVEPGNRKVHVAADSIYDRSLAGDGDHERGGAGRGRP